MNQQVATAMLTKLGYAVDVATHGTEALLAFPHADYAAVLMDLQMPIMDGYEAAAAIRRLEAGPSGDSGDEGRTPIIAVTANALTGDRQKALDAGMDDYVAKPYRSHELAEVLDRWLVPGNGGRPAAEGQTANAGTPSPPDILDSRLLGQLQELHRHSGSDFLQRVVATFLASALPAPAALRVALDAPNTHEASSIAHRLKGSSGSVGALRLSDLCAQIEASLDARDLDAATDLIGPLEAESRLVHLALDIELRTLSEPRRTQHF